MQTRYRDRGFVRFPRDPHFHNETQYPPFHTPQNVYQNPRYSTRVNRHDSFQSINHRSKYFRYFGNFSFSYYFFFFFEKCVSIHKYR